MMKKLFLFFLFFAIISTINAQDSLQQYTGKYVFPDGAPVPEVEVTLTDSALAMGSVAGNSALTALGIDSFLIVEFSGTAVFKRAEDNKVNTVHIEAAGYVLDGKKQETGLWIFTSKNRSANGELLLPKK
jgi:hypothetical protein